MSTPIHGRNGTVSVSGITVASVTSFSYEESADTTEATAMTDTERTFLPGISQGSGTVDFQWIDNNAGQIAVKDALRNGTTVTLELDPISGATGSTYTGDVIIVSYSFNQSMDSIVNGSFGYNGVLDSALDKITNHYLERVQSNVRTIRVEELDLDVYVYPLNLAQQERLVKLWNEGENYEAMLESIILRARDEKGVPMFDQKDKEKLRKQADPELLMWLAKEINADAADEDELPTVESAKNS